MIRKLLAGTCMLLVCGLLFQPASAQQVQQELLLPSFEEVSKQTGIEMLHKTALDIKERGSLMMGGAAAGDFNNDGWQDLFVIGGGKHADALFINKGDGTFEDITAQAGLAGLHVGAGAAVADYDDDGDVDIFVTSFGEPNNVQPGQHRLYRNNFSLTGKVEFEDVAAEAGVNRTTEFHVSDIELADGFGASFGDYDLDGDLDLFVAGWVVNSKGNRLFRNKGGGTFEDVTEAAGIVDNGIRGFSPCFADMNRDRYPELLLVADFGTSEYFVNQKDGTFKQHTIGLIVGDDMGSTVGDFNRDGLLDWYITAIYDDDGSGRGEGNKLYINEGAHSFEEIARQAGVDDGGWGWGTVAVDLNHDGWLDLVETNGWPLPSYENELSKVWINQGQNLFTEVAETTGFVHRKHGMGMLRLDYDLDGDQDIVVTAANDNLNLFRNDLAAEGANWLRVVLDTSGNARLAPHGIGSVVRIRAAGQNQYHFMTACPHYLSQSELTAHFGLGDATTIEEVLVAWPDGSVTTLSNQAANQTITIKPTPVVELGCENRCVAFLPLLASPGIAGEAQ